MTNGDQVDVVTRRFLDTLSPGLASRFPGIGNEHLRQIAATVAEMAVTSADLGDHQLLGRALEVMQRGSTESERRQLEAAVSSLVEELDRKAWDLQDEAEAEHVSEEDYVRLLEEKGYTRVARQASAAEAVAAALNPDPLVAATEAICSASFATKNLNILRRKVAEVLGEPMRLLDTLSPDLRARLLKADEPDLRRVALAAAELATRSVGLNDPRLDYALDVARGRHADRHAAQDDVKALVEKLDRLTFELRQTVDVDPDEREEYLRAFSRARAASSVGSALDADALNAAIWAIYDANQAVSESAALMQVVEEALAGRGS
jgi:beta-galactosidase/beta-glucuronidase